MIKKFKEFRNRLTYNQLQRLIAIIGIIVAMADVCIVILNVEKLVKDAFVDSIGLLLIFLMMDMCIMYLIFLLFNGFQKQYKHDCEEVKQKLNLKYEELLEVVPILKYDGNDLKVCLIYEDKLDVRYFAKLEEDGIRILLSVEGEYQEVEPIIENWLYFDRRFKIKK